MLSGAAPTRDFAGMERRRRAAIADWRRGMLPNQVAGNYGVSHTSVLRWIDRYQREGAAGLRSTRATGRPPRLSAAWLARLPALLLKGAAHFGYLSDLWTLPRVAEVIHRCYGVRYHPAHIWRLLERLGFCWQRPQRQARERDERQVRRWLRTLWPTIKKVPAGPWDAPIPRRVRLLVNSLRGQDLGSPGSDPHPATLPAAAGYRRCRPSGSADSVTSDSTGARFVTPK